MRKKVRIFTNKLNVGEIESNLMNFLHDGGNSLFEIATKS